MFGCSRLSSSIRLKATPTARMADVLRRFAGSYWTDAPVRIQ